MVSTQGEESGRIARELADWLGLRLHQGEEIRDGDHVVLRLLAFVGLAMSEGWSSVFGVGISFWWILPGNPKDTHFGRSPTQGRTHVGALVCNGKLIHRWTSALVTDSCHKGTPLRAMARSSQNEGANGNKARQLEPPLNVFHGFSVQEPLGKKCKHTREPPFNKLSRGCLSP